jgi:hypothetical protein
MSYQWLKNGTNISGATLSTFTIPKVATSDQATYTVKVSNVGGVVTSAGAALTVILPPLITTQPQSVGVVKHASASFSVVAGGIGPFAYQWYFNGSSLGSSAESSTYTIGTVHVHDAGSYAVTVSNVAGTVTSLVAILTVYVAPEIQTQPTDVAVNQGSNASFSVVPSGSAPFSYQWSFNGTSLSHATNSSLTLANVQSNQAGSYSVVVTNPAGSVTSRSAILEVDVPPAIQTQPSNTTGIQGQGASFSVSATGTSPFSYQWRLNGEPLSGATHATLNLSDLATNQAGSYSVQITNVAGSVTSQVATLTVNIPPGIQTQPHGVTVIQGQNTCLSVVATGTPPFSYQWKQNNTALAGATNSVLNLTNVQTTNAGHYKVVVTNAAGSITSASATLAVRASAVTLSTSTGALTHSNGFNLQLTVPTGNTYVIMASSDFVNWTPIATNVSTNASAAFSDLTATNYANRYYRVELQ